MKWLTDGSVLIIETDTIEVIEIERCV